MLIDVASGALLFRCAALLLRAYAITGSHHGQILQGTVPASATAEASLQQGSRMLLALRQPRCCSYRAERPPACRRCRSGGVIDLAGMMASKVICCATCSLVSATIRSTDLRCCASDVAQYIFVLSVDTATTSTCRTIKTCVMLACPEGVGREGVRACVCQCTRQESTHVFYFKNMQEHSLIHKRISSLVNFCTVLI